MPTPTGALQKIAVKVVMNGLLDHYDKAGAASPPEVYWKTRLRLTGAHSLDSYVMGLVRPYIDSGMTSAEEIGKKVLKSLGVL